MKTDIEKTLLSMCYKEVRKDFWAKPVGYHLFTFDIEHMKWHNHFTGYQGQPQIWKMAVLENDEWFRESLCSQEAYSEPFRPVQGICPDYSILTKEETFNLLLS